MTENSQLMQQQKINDALIKFVRYKNGIHFVEPFNYNIRKMKKDCDSFSCSTLYPYFFSRHGNNVLCTMAGKPFFLVRGQNAHDILCNSGMVSLVSSIDIGILCD